MRKVSIIMPVYNGERYLEAAIESALQQTYRYIQLIIINDASTDESDGIIHKYCADPRITYIENIRNVGVAASRNIALSHASGELITFLDQDDIWLPRKLQIQLAALDHHPELGLLHARYARIDSSGEMLPYWKRLEQNQYGDVDANTEVGLVFEKLFVSNDIQPLTSMIPKRVIDEVGWFNENLPGVDDYELWLRIARRYPIGRVQTILGYWRKHDSQQSNQGYKMLVMRLKAMDTLLAADPGITKCLKRKIFTQRMHSLTKGTANYYFWVEQDYAKALRYFTRAFGLKITDIDSAFKGAYCALPTGMRDKVRVLRRRIVEVQSKS